MARPRCETAVTRWLIVFALGLVSGCGRGDGREPVQSVLHPASPAADAIAWLWWLMFWICTAIFVVVLVLLAAGLIRRRRAGRPTPPLGNGFIVVGGIVLPAVVLVILLIANLRTSLAMREPESALTIRVVGRQWWWEVSYPEYGITTANELHIPTGRPVRLELRSADVIHSFWVPRLSGKMDMIPGVEFTNLVLRADAPGEYRGQCAEFCGLQHALMAFYVVAMEPAQFEAWVAAKRTPPEIQGSGLKVQGSGEERATPSFPDPRTPYSEPSKIDERLLRGRAVLAGAACGNCHTIRGTEFNGKVGPDLTHIASRLTLGAGTLPNNRGNLEGWISNPQPLKPGNLMPPTYLSADDLHALTDYLETLK